MKEFLLFTAIFICAGCALPRLPASSAKENALSGRDFYESVLSLSTEERERRALQEIMKGNLPAKQMKFRPVQFDTVLNGEKYRVKFFVTGDYLSIGSDKNFARIPLTANVAQIIADSFHCFLPTRRIVDLTYRQSRIRLAPMPMFAYRDSSVTMYQNHLIIEGQRRLQKGLISGIKKDVVMTAQLKNKPGKVAIYGWHRENGQPIQPLYTGHTDKYVDYSHGIRLVHELIIINGKMIHYKEVLRDDTLKQLICDESDCEPTRYAEPFWSH